VGYSYWCAALLTKLENLPREGDEQEMKKIVVGVLTILMMFSAILASAQVKKGPYTFGLAIGWIDNDFGLRVRNGFVETINKMGNAKYIEAVALSQPSKQVTQIENFINLKVDAILISPSDTTALQPLIVKAREVGIPTFCVDTTTYDPCPTFSATSDNYTLGRETMRYIADKLNGKGNLVIFSAPQHEGIRSRVMGVYSVLKKYPGIKVVATHAISWAVGDPTPLDAMQNILRRLPNKGDINAVWAPYDTAAAQISNATVQAGREAEIIITGVDGDKMAIADNINKGSNFEATAAQAPYWMAKTAVEMAYSYLAGEKIPRTVTAPYVIATKKTNLQPSYDSNW
jgi:ribose transport system substrate-binding protein